MRSHINTHTHTLSEDSQYWTQFPVHCPEVSIYFTWQWDRSEHSTVICHSVYRSQGENIRSGSTRKGLFFLILLLLYCSMVTGWCWVFSLRSLILTTGTESSVRLTPEQKSRGWEPQSHRFSLSVRDSFRNDQCTLQSWHEIPQLSKSHVSFL